MYKKIFISITIISLFTIKSFSCTSVIITNGATKDSSAICTYTCDGEFHPILKYYPEANHNPNDSVEIVDWSGNPRGKIPQVPHTYSVVKWMNQHQLAIGETTFGGREELHNPDGLLHYEDLMQLALQRTKTARDAIKKMIELTEKYGYRGEGESFSIVGKKEQWLMEIIGKGPGVKGVIWVAVKVPNGFVTCTANKARIGDFSKYSEENCMHSDDIKSFAIEKGYFVADSQNTFRFCDVYCPPTAFNRRYSASRVWSIFRRIAPWQEFSTDYHRGVEGANPYPLWIKPDEKLSVKDVMNLMRGHYEGTEFDMTKGIDAGPYGSPNRWRPMTLKKGENDYVWERPISTQQTGYSFISQTRPFMRDEIGGLFWYGVDDTYFTCYVPLYVGINSIPKPFATGDFQKFSWDSAWWVFNFVSNYAHLKYSYMMPEIRKVQSYIENMFLRNQEAVETTANLLYEIEDTLATEYLTNYSVGNGEQVVKKWIELGEYLMTKYNDGYVKNENGRPTEKGYPDEWINRVIKERPEQFKLPNKTDKKFREL
ncbi:MAG: C69 family dipeptidase [Candidatus Marinimicrobia bacterium]|nr:C69 family dipeptidase [Candidatus Neomarinimicrobiota bacterium]